MYTISKKDTIQTVHDETGLSKKDIEAVYNAFGNVILDAAKNGDKFFMRGILTLTPYLRAKTQRRNPRTGEVIDVEEKNSLRFNPGKLLKEALLGTV
jgi:nucleoid DNA-binding protein